MPTINYFPNVLGSQEFSRFLNSLCTTAPENVSFFGVNIHVVSVKKILDTVEGVRTLPKTVSSTEKLFSSFSSDFLKVTKKIAKLTSDIISSLKFLEVAGVIIGYRQFKILNFPLPKIKNILSVGLFSFELKDKISDLQKRDQKMLEVISLIGLACAFWTSLVALDFFAAPILIEQNSLALIGNTSNLIYKSLA